MRTLTVKLYGSDDFGYLSDMINIAGIIYNTALTIIEDHYTETGKLLDKYELQKQLRGLRNEDENHHWRYVGSQAVQEIADRIYRAYRLFFTNREKGVKCSPPRRRKVKKYKSVTYKQAGCRVCRVYIHIDNQDLCGQGSKTVPGLKFSFRGDQVVPFCERRHKQMDGACKKLFRCMILSCL